CLMLRNPNREVIARGAADVKRAVSAAKHIDKGAHPLWFSECRRGSIVIFGHIAINAGQEQVAGAWPIHPSRPAHLRARCRRSAGFAASAGAGGSSLMVAGSSTTTVGGATISCAGAV